jgi:hypothetical protein
METLGEAYPKEQARIREELIPAYIEIGPVGRFGLVMLEDLLRRADKAVIEGDLVKMVKIYEEMKGCQ